MDETIIALAPVRFSGIKIQATVYQKEGKIFINSVNILCGTKIIQKIKQKRGGVEMEMFKAEQIASDYLIRLLKSGKKTVSNSNQKVKKNTVNNLMDEFNL